MTIISFNPPDGPREHREPAAAAYAELAVTSNYSFLRGASHPEELVRQAMNLGLCGIGIADRNSVAGVVRAHVAGREWRQKEIDEGGSPAPFSIAVGARLVFDDGTTPDILAYPRDRAAWGRLTRLLSLGKLRAEKGDCLLGLPDLLQFIDGLNLVVMPPSRIEAAALGRLLDRLKKAGSRNAVWLGAAMLYRGDDARRLVKLAAVARDAAVPLIAVNDVLYHAPERRELQDVVTCVRERVTIDSAGRLLQANAERHLKPPAEMARLFRKYPDVIGETARFIAACRFSLEELRGTEYPEEIRQGFATSQDALVAYVEEGVARRFRKECRRPSEKSSTRNCALSASCLTRRSFSPCMTLFAMRGRKGKFFARDAARRRIRSFAIAWALPKSGRTEKICCSSGLSRSSATSRPTSTSISSTSGAKKSSSTSIANIRASAPGSPPP